MNANVEKLDLTKSGYQRLPMNQSADDRLDELIEHGVGIAVVLREALASSDTVTDRRFSRAADALLETLHEVLEIRDRANGTPNPGRIVTPGDEQ
jgi:hypothetical protein